MVTITLENGQEDMRLEIKDEFLWIQITYDQLRAGDNFNREYDIAWMNDDADWYIDHQYAREHNIIDEGPYSDIIIG